MALHYLHRHVPFQEKTVFVMNTLENVTSLRQDGPEAIQELQTDARSVEQIDDQDPGAGSATPDKGNPREAGSPAGVSGERQVQHGRRRAMPMTYDKKNSLVMAAQSWSGT